MSEKTADKPSKKSLLAPFHTFDPEKALSELGVDRKNGLSSQEAAKRLQKYGPNELDKEEPESIWEKIKEQFEDLLVRLLLLAAVVSFVVSQLGKKTFCLIFTI